MEGSVQLIPLGRLALALVPAILVVAVLMRWSLEWKHATVAVARMVIQLLVVGFGLVFIFESDTPWVLAAVLLAMITASAWIALRTIPERRSSLYWRAWLCVLGGGGLTFVLITQLVLRPEPWYYLRYTIPLAGMIFSNAMTSISLAAERFYAERSRGADYEAARRIALTASLIPITNAMLAVGLVSLPGMMTGQILSGVDPLLAVRYQVMVMCMVYGASGLASALFLMTLRGRETAASELSAEGIA